MVTISSPIGLVDRTRSPPRNLILPSPLLDFDSDDHDRRMVTHSVSKSLLTRAIHQMYRAEPNRQPRV